MNVFPAMPDNQRAVQVADIDRGLFSAVYHFLADTFAGAHQGFTRVLDKLFLHQRVLGKLAVG